MQTAVKRSPSPTFFQHVTHEVFKSLRYSLNVQESEGAVGKRITLEEENAIRYISGYVCRKLGKKIEDCIP